MKQKTTTNNLKLQGRDFINIGIFTVLFIIAYMVCVMLLSLTAYTQPFGIAAAAVLGAPVYMLLRTKTPKTGAIIIFGVLLAIIFFVMGNGWPLPTATIIGAIIAELIAKAGQYKSYKHETVGYVIFMTLSAIGSYTPMVIMRDYYIEISVANGVDEAYMEQIAMTTTVPYLVLACVVTAVMAILGTFLARAMFKKHFVKAGLIKEVK